MTGGGRGFRQPGIVLALTVLMAVGWTGVEAWRGGATAMAQYKQQFQGKEAALEASINADDPAAAERALTAGADVNARGAHGVTPLEFAVGTFRKKVVRVLLGHGADSAARDVEGNNAVTIALLAWSRDPELLRMLLAAGADPNTRMNDDDPIISAMNAFNDLEGIRLLHKAGADIDIRTRTGKPLIVEAANIENWDVVWLLLELGARYDYSDEPNNIQKAFRGRSALTPGSPRWNDKAKVWRFLKERGLKVPPMPEAE